MKSKINIFSEKINNTKYYRYGKAILNKPWPEYRKSVGNLE